MMGLRLTDIIKWVQYLMMNRTAHFREGTSPALLHRFIRQYSNISHLLSTSGESQQPLMKHLWAQQPQAKHESGSVDTLSTMQISRARKDIASSPKNNDHVFSEYLQVEEVLMRKSRRKQYQSPEKQDQMKNLIQQFMGQNLLANPAESAVKKSHCSKRQKSPQKKQNASEVMTPKQFTINLQSSSQEAPLSQCMTFRAIKTPKIVDVSAKVKPSTTKKYQISKQETSHKKPVPAVSNDQQGSRSRSKSKSRLQVISVKRIDKEESLKTSHVTKVNKSNLNTTSDRKKMNEEETYSKSRQKQTNRQRINHQRTRSQLDKTNQSKSRNAREEMPIKISIDIPLEELQPEGPKAQDGWERQRQQIIKEISTRVCTLLNKSKHLVPKKGK